jgi:hypothetical protein
MPAFPGYRLPLARRSLPPTVAVIVRFFACYFRVKVPVPVLVANLVVDQSELVS